MTEHTTTHAADEDVRNRDIKIYVNGDIVHRDEAKVSVFDSLVQGGDGCWEGLRLYDGRIFKLDQHLTRLRHSAKALAFEDIPDSSLILDAIRQTLEAIDTVNALARKYPETLAMASNAAEVSSLFARGHIASLMGMEGGHQIDSSVMALRQFHALGVRYMTLTHNCNAGDPAAPWAGSCCPISGPTNVGLSEFGRNVVAEMNRMGMMVDLSHTSVETMSDALDVTRAPPIFSHSNARALCDVPRNVPDSILDRLPSAPEGGGVVCVTFVPGFLVPGGVNASLSNVVDHIMYIGNRIGYDHVCIGSDFDGVETLPAGLATPADYPDLFAELIRRGVSDDNINAILSGNLLRVLAATERVAAQLQADEAASYQLTPVFNDSCRNFLN